MRRAHPPAVDKPFSITRERASLRFAPSTDSRQFAMIDDRETIGGFPAICDDCHLIGTILDTLYMTIGGLPAICDDRETVRER